MSSIERSHFEQCALVSGLITVEQLDQARASVRWSQGDQADANAPPTDMQLADRLVELGFLNTWQAKQLLDSRTKFNLGSYWIVDSIGKGGMGQVFKAQQNKSGPIVAIKVLPRDKCTPDAVANFYREIKALSSLSHTKLVAALDAGQDGNVHYLVTEYVPGVDLRKLIRHAGPLGMSAAANIVQQVAEGLGHAHSRGIIHRDVKPGNVLVTPEGIAKLSDLGLAGPLNANAQNDPRYGRIVGTADYLSPDQVRGPWNPTPSWDIYALGCTTYYIVTGKVPFPGGTTADKARAHCELRPLDPRLLNPRLTAEFLDVMADMMAKDPEHRIPSCLAVIERLKPWLPGGPLADAATGALGEYAQPKLHSTQPILLQTLAERQSAALAQANNINGLDHVALPDTKVDYPELPQVSESHDSSSKGVVTILDLLSEAESSKVKPHRAKVDWMKIVSPMLFLIICIPLALVITVVLIWWIFEMIIH